MTAQSRPLLRGKSIHMTEMYARQSGITSTLLKNRRRGGNLLTDFIPKAETSQMKTKTILGASQFKWKTFFKPVGTYNFISRPETTWRIFCNYFRTSVASFDFYMIVIRIFIWLWWMSSISKSTDTMWPRSVIIFFLNLCVYPSQLNS